MTRTNVQIYRSAKKGLRFTLVLPGFVSSLQFGERYIEVKRSKLIRNFKRFFFQPRSHTDKLSPSYVYLIFCRSSLYFPYISIVISEVYSEINNITTN